MEKFIFDLQRFATTFTGVEISTPSDTVYYDLGTTGGTLTWPTSTTNTFTAGHEYLVVKNVNGTYTFSVQDYTEPAGKATWTETAKGTVELSGMKFTSGAQKGAVEETATGSATITDPVLTTYPGGSITAAIKSTTATYTDASGSGATITFDTDGAVTDQVLTSGSVLLTSNSDAKSIKATDTPNDVFTVDNTGKSSIVVSSAGVVSSIAAGSKFYVGAVTSTGTNTITYTVSGDGGRIDVVGGATTDLGTYLFNSSSALSNFTITANNTVDEKIDTLGDGVIKLSGTAIGTIGTSAGTVGAEGSTEGKTYLYIKNGTVVEYGYTDNTFGTCLGETEYNASDDVYSYSASSSSTGETITAATKLASIVGSTGKDKINTSGGTSLVYVNGGDGDDSIDGALSKSSMTIVGGAGKDSINVTSGGGVNELLIDGGSDADSIIAGAGITYSTILGGDGDDTLTSYADSNTVTGGAGADIFDLRANSTELNIADYNAGEDFVLVGGTYASAAAAARDIATGTVGSVTDAGVLTAGVGGTAPVATVTGSGYYAVNLRDTNKKSQLLGWVGESGTAIDASTFSSSVVLTGRTNSEGDSLYGGSGKDTIYAGSSDTVWGAAGNDVIEIGTGKGVVVGINSASGKDVVNGFHTGFEDGDSIFLVDTEVADASISTATTGTITLKAGSSSTTINGGAANVVNFLINDSKVVTAANGATIAASEANYADFYFGTKNGTVQSALSFSSVSDNVNVDLSDSKKYKNINIVMGGTADNTLMGSSAKETLMAAAGSNTSLYGGAGADSLVGNTGSDNFFFGAGAGKDTVSAFTAGTSDTSDRLTLIDGTIDPTQISRSSASVMKATLNNSDALTVSFANGKVDDKIQFTTTNGDLVAKVGITGATNTFTLDNEVNYYIGSTKLDTLTVSDDDNHEVWLDNANYASIDVINATSSSGNNILAGSSTANTIRAGKGDSSIWGGAGNVADSLVGGTGADTFFWGAGEGNDTVVGNSDDSVNLYSLKLSELTDWSYSSNSLSLTFGEQKLTVNGQVNDYTIEGHTYTLNRSDGTWSEKQ